MERTEGAGNAVTLRAAGTADLPMIFRAERAYMTQVEPGQLAAWQAAADRNLELWIANLGRTMVAVRCGADAGYAMWTPAGNRATVITIHVFPQYRRHGIGGTLLSALAGAAAGEGAVALDLGVHAGNEARALYERSGFGYTGDDGDYRLYTLPLAAA